MSLKEKILVIDDDESIVELISTALTQAGFNVFSSLNGDEGLRLFEAGKPDLVIVDALIPKVNGFEVATRIRRTDFGNQIPIVMISGIYKALRMNDQIRSLDINDFIEKPFNMEELVSRCQQLLLINEEERIQVVDFKPKGKLEEVSFPRLLYLLYIKKENGSLLLAKEKLKKKIYFRDGEPTFIESNLVQECLGKQLVRRGLLTQEQCDESLRQMKNLKTRQGETLIQMGLLTANDLDQALKDQARDKLFEIFGWENGTYQFTATQNAKPGLTAVDITLPQIILRGIRDGYPFERLKKEMDSNLNFAIQVRQNPYLDINDFKLATWDERVYKEIDGKLTFSDLLKSKVAREQDIYQLMLAFSLTELIDFAEDMNSREAKASAAKLRRLTDELKEQDYYTLLGVDHDASSTDLFKAMSKKMRLYHPTTTKLNPGKTPEMRVVLQDITDLLKRAHDTLASVEHKKVYDRNLFLEKGVIPQNPNGIFDPEIEFRKIKIELDKGEYEKAEPLLRRLTALFADDWRFAVYHAWTRFKIETMKKKQSKQSLNNIMRQLGDAVKSAPGEAEGYLYLGMIYKYLEENETAKSFFKKAVHCDANCVDAERELRLLIMREQKSSKSFIKWK